ncbi:hypothetical protein HMPREF9996_01489 [Aggregatibacter actinomycetemcomitans Y4]|uniref:hypothetical protein n=1 Tax=Aggregatibacter actinomycetemcomitans TaxID=714 RepID=UPI0002A26AEB|nr:hypothetical protein [Aggregatibacter actinomycetemcomitans]EKX95661.1 hypothetical protein HMPREF9996_01489 [Aggregatibacter actinomycetemcomitans Y4]
MVPLSDVTKQTVKEKHNPEKSRDYYNVQPYLPAITAEQREIRRLQAENEQLSSDNALLKKVSAFLIDKQ